MKKNKKPLTDAQREAKRERDRKYRAAKKAAKVAEVKKSVAKNPTAKKPKAEPIPVKKGEVFVAKDKNYVSVGGNKAVEVKKPEAKKVAKPVKTALPKPTVAVVEPRHVHIIKPGDAIHFDGFTADKIVALATGIICETAVKDHQRRLAEAFKEFTRRGAKALKKEAKK